MDRVPVTSSSAVAIGFDSESKILEIEFQSGIYQYINVPSSVHEELMAADSIGQFINSQIKPVYQFNKVY